MKHLNKKNLFKSLDGIERATPPSGLYDGVMNELNQKPVLHLSTRRWVAATVAMLILANTIVLSKKFSATNNTIVKASEYKLITNYNIYNNEE